MRSKVAIGLAAGVWTEGAIAHEAKPRLLHEEHVGGVYSQQWYGQTLAPRDGFAADVYVVGDGKLGDFQGVLAVHCAVPSHSVWLATGGYLTTDDVPSEAIVGLRRMVCG